jgi:hypothetical protein
MRGSKGSNMLRFRQTLWVRSGRRRDGMVGSGVVRNNSRRGVRSDGRGNMFFLNLYYFTVVR